MKQNSKNEKMRIGNDKTLPDIKSKPADEVTELAESIIDTVREPLLILDKDLRVVKASQSFFDFFKVSPEETIGTLIYDLGNRQWDIPKLKELLEKILPEKTTFDNYEVEHDFVGIGNRILLLNARQIERVFGKEKIILLAIEDITERKHLEDSLSETSRMTSEYLDILVNHAHFPIIIWDASFVITRFNNSFEKLSGYDVSEVMGKKIDFLFPESKRESTLKLLEDFLGEEKFEIIEIDILRKDKEIRTVLWNSANVFDKEGKLIITTIAQDITKRKQTEDALKESEEVFNHFLENSPYYVFFKDKNIRAIRLSTNYEQMLGKPLNSLLGKTMDELFPSEFAKKMVEVDKVILNRRETVIVEEEFNGRNFTTIKFPIIINDIPQYLAGFTIDITEQKNAEAALRENEKFLRETQKIAQLGSYTLDINTGIWKSSEILDTIFGIESDYDKSVEGWTSIIHPEWRQLMADYLANEVIGLRKSFDKEYKIVRKSDKAERWVHGLGELVVDKENKPIKMIGTIRDITDLKNAEREIVNLNRVYALLSNTNEAIVRIKDRQKLFDEICRIAIDNGKFRMAWIGIVNNDTNKVDVEASAGVIENYLDEINIDLSSELRSKGPVGKAVKSGTNIIVKDIENDEIMLPWKENALRLGYKSCAMFPLNVFGKVFGVFSIYSNQKDFFLQQEIRLLDEMAMDISFAVEFLETEKNRKIVEENLRISEERFRSLYENSTVGLYRTTPDGTILMANKVLVKMLGYPSFEALASRNVETGGFGPSYPRKHFIEMIEKNGEVINFESEWTRQDGSKFFVRESAQAIRDSHGSTLYYDGVVEDITGRKLAEDELKKSEARLKMALETNQSGVWDLNLLDHTAHRSLIHDQIFGYKTLLPSWTFEMFLEHVLPEDRQYVHRIFNEAVEAQTNWNFECRIRRADGELRWILANGGHELNSEGKSVRITGIVQDITERKQVEENLRISEERFRNLISTVKLLTVTLDLKGNITFCNDFLLELTGWKLQEVQGKNWFNNFLPEDVVDEVKQVFHKSIHSEDFPPHYQNEIITRKGARKIIEWNNTVLRDADRKIIGSAS
ncbi:MAG: PAS domain S-box protein, partial [Bacteroidales bacterium]|nr:PAS domain S-box protein [Bacteroidales bacterium]